MSQNKLVKSQKSFLFIVTLVEIHTLILASKIQSSNHFLYNDFKKLYLIGITQYVNIDSV